ncbi:alpha-glucuronidase family glycosyl hydrolase [Actinopolymorpha sp. B17G11]|uniref:alpha-glucuronidase family glycosyl hydrolase n=1 Tax=Actinopolymorpha sp. B17G11 TaxID=3160861 RepID=UPI0032E4C94F
MDARLNRRRFLQAGALAASVSAGLSGGQQPAAGATTFRGVARPEPEDGYDLWLRYRLVGDAGRLAEYRHLLPEVVVEEDSARIGSVRTELGKALPGLLGRDVPFVEVPTRPSSLVVGTWDGSPLVRSLVSRGEIERVGPEGFLIRWRLAGGRRHLVVAGTGGAGVLHGTFALLRRLQRHQSLRGLDVDEHPRMPLRLVNHWDNLSRSVERGYAGRSLFDWNALPAPDPRYTDYARALASLGINGTVVNNVNANPAFLTSDMIVRLAGLADALRPWGVRFHLSANFAAPLALGELPTADPLDPAVQTWWRDKADEIYAAIPDFGGFLVKANSEGQPGPTDYGRTHADGANALAQAVHPYGGIVMWRAFVYDASDGDVSTDAYETFTPLDGEFAENVVLQAKYGPVDFHIREPVHPLFGAMPQTNMMLELQITQEHTGHATDLCYLPTWWSQVLDFDTRARGKGTTVARVVDGTAYDYAHCGAAGVLNWGDERTWSGHHLAAANAHGYGRLMWDPSTQPAEIAREWTELTFGTDPAVVEPVRQMLLGSWQTFENYTSPLGVGNMVAASGGHYAPDPVGSQSAHRSDADGTGFDRTAATGTGFTALYHQPWRQAYESLADCPDELLLFMHQVPYDHRLHSGRTVLDHIYETHFAGLATVEDYRKTWGELADRIDERRHAEVLARFDQHVEHATAWRDSVVGYYFELSRRLATNRSWVQITVPPESELLLGGWPTRVPMRAGNASPDSLDVTARVDISGAPGGPDGWTARTAAAAVSSQEFATLVPTVVPPAAGLDATLDLDVAAGDLPVIGATGVAFSVAPAAQLCHLALDAGGTSSPLFTSYDRLTPNDAWDADRGYGWVGPPPEFRDRGSGLDPLRRDFCNATRPATLRVRVPAGTHEAYLLVGDVVGSSPTVISSDGAELGRSDPLPGGVFAWVHFPLDGEAAGRDVDLELASLPGEHWHLNAFTIVDATAAPPPVVVGAVSDSHLRLLPGEPTPVRFWLYNFTDADRTVEPVVIAADGYTAELETPRVDVPGGGDVEVTVTVTRGAAAGGGGELTFTIDGDSRAIGLQPVDNWLVAAQLSASSTHTPSSVANLNDGNTDSEQWGGGGAGGWNDGTPGVFPDSVTAAWPHPVPLGRVTVHTLDAEALPASVYGVRDYDVEIHAVGGEWQVVAEVRGNTTGAVGSSFDPTETDALRIVVHDSNDHAYSRLVEIEAFSS